MFSASCDFIKLTIQRSDGCVDETVNKVSELENNHVFILTIKKSVRALFPWSLALV